MTEQELYVLEYRASGDQDWRVLSGEEKFAFTDLDEASETMIEMIADEQRAIDEFEPGTNPGDFRVSIYKRV